MEIKVKNMLLDQQSVYTNFHGFCKTGTAEHKVHQMKQWPHQMQSDTRFKKHHT
jgi:hypothetical protein